MRYYFTILIIAISKLSQSKKKEEDWMSVEELGANCTCRSIARCCYIDIWILWPWESNPVFTDILQKRTLENFCEVLCCKIQSCRTESCLTPPCWKSSLKNKPRVMKCWEMIVTCSSPGFTTPAKSFLNPFEPLWSFL